MLVGGKGANLGELARMEGIHVPEGFCISTQAFQKIVGEAPSIHELLDRLSLLKVEAREKIAELSGEIRRVIEGIAIPAEMEEEISRRLAGLGEKDPYAVRSSATAEDLPGASFAGQQDTFLNVGGSEAVLDAVTEERTATKGFSSCGDSYPCRIASATPAGICPCKNRLWMA